MSFLTFITPTFRRPQRLAACLASVGAQTLVSEIEHIVLPDHVGIGIDGMYASLPHYASAVHGEYVHILADDDVLAGPTVVEQVKRFAEQQRHPPVIVVNVVKFMEEGALLLPTALYRDVPIEGQIDLGCIITRRDVWLQHVGDYGHRYEGDADHMLAMHRAGHAFARAEIFFLKGAVMRGRAEAA